MRQILYTVHKVYSAGGIEILCVIQFNTTGENIEKNEISSDKQVAGSQCCQIFFFFELNNLVWSLLTDTSSKENREDHRFFRHVHHLSIFFKCSISPGETPLKQVPRSAFVGVV